MISQGYQELRDVAREREFTGKMIAGIKNDIKRMPNRLFPRWRNWSTASACRQAHLFYG